MARQHLPDSDGVQYLVAAVIKRQPICCTKFEVCMKGIRATAATYAKPNWIGD